MGDGNLPLRKNAIELWPILSFLLFRVNWHKLDILAYIEWFKLQRPCYLIWYKSNGVAFIKNIQIWPSYGHNSAFLEQFGWNFLWELRRILSICDEKSKLILCLFFIFVFFAFLGHVWVDHVFLTFSGMNSTWTVHDLLFGEELGGNLNCQLKAVLKNEYQHFNLLLY